MDIYHKIYEKYWFPFFEGVIKGRNTAKLFRSTFQSQYLSKEDLIDLQLISLKKILIYSSQHSLFFKNRFKSSGFDPFAIRSLVDILSLPIMTKNDIRNHYNDIKINTGVPLWKKSTGGSTGEPLHFGYTQESYEWRNAVSRRGYSWAGAAPGTKQAYIWGVQLGEVPKYQKIKELIHHFIDRQKFFNCFNFGEAEMNTCLTSLNRWKPQVLIGYTNPLYEFALYVESVGGPIFRPKSILCAAEKVHNFQRKVLERVFGCPVYNTYGSREFMLIASECEKHEGLHVSMENLIVEVVDDEGLPTAPGEVGRILVTDLHNYGMPFIRYEIGDMARVTERQCSCERGLILLDDIIGRSLDIIRTPDGKAVPGEFFPHLLKDYPQVARFQIVQKKLNSLNIKYQLFSTFSADTMQDLIAEIRKVVGPQMEIVFDEVDDIPLTSSGKYRVTISELDH